MGRVRRSLEASALCAQPRLLPFVDLIHKKRQFKGWDNNRHNDFVLAAREIINKYIGSGFVAIVRRNDYANFYKRPEKPQRIPVDTAYGVLFRGCVSFCLGVVAYSLNEKVDDEVVSFVLESGGVKPGYIKDLYGRFKTDRHADPAIRGMLGPEVRFAKKSESPGCQAADLMLGGAIRQERTEHGVQPSRIERSPTSRSRSTARMSPPSVSRSGDQFWSRSGRTCSSRKPSGETGGRSTAPACGRHSPDGAVSRGRFCPLGQLLSGQ